VLIRVRAPLALVFVLLLSVTAAAGPQAPSSPASDPDALFRQREDLTLAAKAASIWQAQLAANPRDFTVACKLSRARFWMGERVSTNRSDWYKLGMEAAEVAIRIAPGKPDGHFWLGVNMGGFASTAGMWAALKYRGSIREALERSVALDPRYSNGGATCALGKYYSSLPSLIGGNKRKAEELLHRCIAADPSGTVGHYYLGQALAAMDRVAEARAELTAAIAAPIDPDNEPECKIWKRRADRLLKRLDGK
jgi:tetratricopeptide (TPR) repeat protein